MITPDDIRAKAIRLYPQMVAAWLAGEEFFPRPVPANLDPSRIVSEAIAQQQLLRAHSKAVLGHGYTLRLESRRSRDYGQQEFATGISFEDRDDLLRLIGKLAEFQRLSKAVAIVRSRQPRLETWLRANWKRLLTCVDCTPDLLDVVDYLLTHPRPNCFIRELPLAISTKLIEQHSSVLAQWLDELLDGDAIDVTFKHDKFASRYGFRSPDDQICLRILDEEIERELQCPGSEVWVPWQTLEKLPVRDARLILVENKINLLTLPPASRTVALGGHGKAITRFERLSWINDCRIYYWGDLDVEGFEILASVRRIWPHTESLLMSCAELDQFQSLIIPGNKQPESLRPPGELTEAELATFWRCYHNQWRLEQERIPQAMINAALVAQTRRG